jgi:hypothetical protein
MPAKSTTVVVPDTTHTKLLAGFAVKERADGSVITIKSSAGKTVAEVCVGSKKVRLNVKSERGLSAAQRKLLGGKSKSWVAGGVNVTADNLEAARGIIAAVVGAAPDATAAERKPQTAARVKRLARLDAEAEQRTTKLLAAASAA